jgi:hypothetical protein
MINNVEYGVHFSDPIIGTDKLMDDTTYFTDELIYEKSDVIYLKKPQYSKSLLGLKKNYQDSIVIFDISDDFFSNNRNYEKRILSSFDLELETNLEKKYDIKPLRQVKKEEKEFILKKSKAKSKSKAVFINRTEKEDETGYCIRTGIEISFDPERPYSYKAYKSWAQFENYNYSENYCHKTGKESYGKTSMNEPVL